MSVSFFDESIYTQATRPTWKSYIELGRVFVKLDIIEDSMYLEASGSDNRLKSVMWDSVSLIDLER